MRLVKFDPRRVNFLEVGTQRLFLLSADGGATFLVNAVCPHRGGPLHLGRLDVSAGVIHCPWHCRRISLRRLEREALPLVLRRDAAVAILPEDAATPIILRQRAILARPGPDEASPSAG